MRTANPSRAPSALLCGFTEVTALANLLSRSQPREPFAALSAEQRARFEERARFLVGQSWTTIARYFEERDREGLGDDAADELEELESAPSLSACQALVNRVDALRRGLPEPPPDPSQPRGDWLLYWPGRSVSSGEAEIASRGFFDVQDRPPLGLWVEAIARARAPGSREFEIAVLCYVPADALEPANAGCGVCPTGALAMLEDFEGSGQRHVGVSHALHTQIRALGH